MNRWAGKPWPVSATAFRDGELRVRLSGAKPAVEAAIGKIGGTRVDTMEAGGFWAGLREQTDPYFAGAPPLWRLSVRSTAPPLPLPGECLVEWGGALRWLKTGADAARYATRPRRRAATRSLFRGGDKSAGVFHPLPEGLMAVHRRLKRAFDPAGILNPGRLYADL
jgi:glycolate oxidase FAD binding subunit